MTEVQLSGEQIIERRKSAARDAFFLWGIKLAQDDDPQTVLALLETARAAAGFESLPAEAALDEAAWAVRLWWDGHGDVQPLRTCANELGRVLLERLKQCTRQGVIRRRLAVLIGVNAVAAPAMHAMRRRARRIEELRAAGSGNLGTEAQAETAA